MAVKNCNKHKTLTSKMEIRVADACELCGDQDTIVHAFLFSERAHVFLRYLTTWSQNMGYTNIRLEQKKIILGDTEKGKLLNLAILIRKISIYQSRAKRGAFSMVHYESLI